MKSKNTRARLGEFKGFSVVSVIRQCGAAGWTAKEVEAALAAEKIKPAANTIFIQLNCGRKKAGKLAEIPSKELAALRPKIDDEGAARDDKKPSKKSAKGAK